MPQSKVPVGLATQAGLGGAVTALVGSVVAFVVNGPQAGVEGVTGAASAVLLALAVIAGRYVQSNTLAKKAEAAGEKAVDEVKTFDPGFVEQAKAELERLGKALENKLDKPKPEAPVASADTPVEATPPALASNQAALAVQYAQTAPTVTPAPVAAVPA